MRSHFAHALSQVLSELNMTQLAFASAVGVSHSLVTKLLYGEEAHRKTYEKIFSYVRTLPGRDALVQELLVAHLRDVVAGTGMADRYYVNERTLSVLSPDDIAKALSSFPPSIMNALVLIGLAARKDAHVENSLMSLAKFAISLQTPHQQHYFESVLHGRSPSTSDSWRHVEEWARHLLSPRPEDTVSGGWPPR